MRWSGSNNDKSNRIPYLPLASYSFFWFYGIMYCSPSAMTHTLIHLPRRHDFSSSSNTIKDNAISSAVCCVLVGQWGYVTINCSG
jgi:hypothetical protein